MLYNLNICRNFCQKVLSYPKKLRFSRPSFKGFKKTKILLPILKNCFV